MTMPEHGELDSKSQQKSWFCGYWMSLDEWEDIHDYPPPNISDVALEHEEQEEG